VSVLTFCLQILSRLSSMQVLHEYEGKEGGGVGLPLEKTIDEDASSMQIG